MMIMTVKSRCKQLLGPLNIWNILFDCVVSTRFSVIIGCEFFNWMNIGSTILDFSYELLL